MGQIIGISISDSWQNCPHEWKYVESQADYAVECVLCGCPGQEYDGEVEWPTT